MSGPRFVDALPPRSSGPTTTASGRTAATIRAVVVLAQNVGQWAEVLRISSTTSGGHPNTTAHQKARRWREYGLDAQVRRDGDEYVMYARVPEVQP